MSPEETKEYMKIYYKNHKDEMITKRAVKIDGIHAGHANDIS